MKLIKYFFFFCCIFFSLSSFSQQRNLKQILQHIQKTQGEIRVGLVLGGGGAKGLAHIGVIKVLEEAGIRVDYVGGTSMGGLVGGLYALGNSPEQLDSIVDQMEWDRLLSDELSRRELPMDEKMDVNRYVLSLPLVGFIPNLPRGVVNGQLIKNELSKLSWVANDVFDFSLLPIPFFCLGTDIENGEAVVLDKGRLASALRATMSIPSVFEPVEYRGRLLVDGGLVNNYPVDVMRKKGMNFIIGVNVGDDRLKKDDIENVLQVMEQATMFYGDISLKKNIKNTDLYIRPDISGLSVLDFSDTDEIIGRGEKVARKHMDEFRLIASFLRTQRDKQRNTQELIQSDTLLLSQVNILGSNQKSKSFIRSRLQLEFPGYYTIDEVNEAVNRVYYSGFFQNISYDLVKTKDAYVLELRLKHKTTDLFRLGGHYDDYNKAALLLNIRKNDFLFEGSKTNLSFILGQNPAISASYLLDRGSKIGLGLKSSYSNRELRTYNDDFTNVTSSFFHTFYNIDLLGYTNFVNNRRLSFGGRYEYFHLSSNVSYIPDLRYSASFIHLFADYAIDYYDDGVYPTQGLRADIHASQIYNADYAPMIRLRAELEAAIPLGTQKIIFQPGLTLGSQFGDYVNYPYLFLVGGQNVRIYQNMVDFAGMAYTSQVTPHMAIATSKFRWNFHKKHYLFLIQNMGVFNSQINHLFTDSKLYYGGALGYSLNSLIGPIDLSISSSNQGPSSYLILAIGYWF